VGGTCASTWPACVQCKLALPGTQPGDGAATLIVCLLCRIVPAAHQQRGSPFVDEREACSYCPGAWPRSPDSCHLICPSCANAVAACLTGSHRAVPSRVANVTTEAAHVMTKATEHFIGWLTKKAMANKDVRDRKKVCLNYQDLTPLLEQNPEQLEFATDL